MNNLKHWSELKNNINVCYDITTAVDNSKVNGSALFYNNENIPNPSGFGMFKDKIGNLIVVIDESTKQSKKLIDGSFFGFDSKAELRKNCPIIDAGTTNEGLFGNKNYTRTDRAINLNKGYVNGGYSGDWGGEKPTSKNFFDTLTAIENKGGNPFKEPIIIYWGYDEGIKLLDILEFALAVASSFAGPLKIDPKIFQDVSKLLKVWGSGDVLKNSNSIFNSLAMTSEILLPEWTKGVSAKYENIKSEVKLTYGKYIEQAKSGYESLQSGLNDVKNINKFQSIIGLDKIELTKYFENIKSGKYSYVVNLTKINGSLMNANKTLAGVTTSFTNELIKSKMLVKDTFVNEILSTGLTVYDTPLINNIFQSGSASTILQGIVASDKIIPAIIKKEKKRLDKMNLAGLIASGFGYVGPQENFDEMTLNALISQAQSYAINKIPFVLPDTIPIDKRERFAKEIEKTANVKVVGYEDNWDYDTTLRKMAPVGIAIAVAGGLWYANKKKMININ